MTEECKKLADGSYGSVYYKEKKAFKVYKINNPNIFASALTEIYFLSSFSHPSIIPYHGMSINKNYLTMVTPLIDKCLVDDITSCDPATVFYQIGTALEAMHNQGFIHRDIKPDNIVYTKDQAYLIDFGSVIRCALNEVVELNNHLSKDYLAPEVFKSGTYSNKSDVWAFGISFFSVLTGCYPFPSYETPSISQMNVDFAVKTKLKECMVEKYEPVILACLQVNPKMRKTMHEVLKMLRPEHKKENLVEIKTEKMSDEQDSEKIEALIFRCKTYYGSKEKRSLRFYTDVRNFVCYCSPLISSDEYDVYIKTIDAMVSVFHHLPFDIDDSINKMLVRLISEIKMVVSNIDDIKIAFGK